MYSSLYTHIKNKSEVDKHKHQEPSCPARVCAHAPLSCASRGLLGHGHWHHRTYPEQAPVPPPPQRTSFSGKHRRSAAGKEGEETTGQHKRLNFLSQPASGLFSLCSHSECQQRHPRSNSCVLESFGWQPRPPQAPPSWPAPGVWSPGSQQGLHDALPSHCGQQSWPWAAHTQGHCLWHSPEAGAGIAFGLLGAEKGLVGPF